MAERAFYVDLTRKGPFLGFAKCRTWRTPATYAEYVAQFPKCVTTTWLETLSGDEKERQARIRYAVLVKQIAVMKACYEPGNRAIFTSSAVPEGIDLFEAVASLEKEHARLVEEIESGRLCSNHQWQPPSPQVVAGYYDSELAGEGAKDSDLWESCRRERFEVVRKENREWNVRDTAWVSSIYQLRFAEKYGIDRGRAANAAWNVPAPHGPVEELLDLTRPEGDSFAACRVRDKPTSYVEYVAKFPKCLSSSKLGRLMSKPDAELRIEYAVLAKQVAVMEKCFGRGMAPIYVRTDPRKNADIKVEVERLRARHTALSTAISEGTRCQAQAKNYAVGSPPMPTALEHYLDVTRRLGIDPEESHILELRNSVAPAMWYVDKTFASLGRREDNAYFLMTAEYHNRNHFRAHVLNPDNPVLPGATLSRDFMIERDPITKSPGFVMRAVLQSPDFFLKELGQLLDGPTYEKARKKLNRMDRMVELVRRKGINLTSPSETMHTILTMERELLRLEAEQTEKMASVVQ